ncbi:Spo0B C-terminal domain-containing protein [Metabacillus sp. Hm71]|uniref:Spo0B C-terminal domain-containing protein n=1 Tax=Metabacillus sp. Hm71 TaxID=3450743 RepID=UPI003F43ACB9
MSMKNNLNEWNIVDLLSHSRHDWMNKLQLIKGNLSLQKYERVNDIIEEVIMEAQHESKLCNLKMPEFASYLLTYNWNKHHLLLEYEILGDVRSLEPFDESVTQWSRSFLDILESTVDRCSENHVSITIDLDSDKAGVRFFFDFNGIINKTDQIENWLKAVDHSRLVVNEYHVDTYELTTVISFGI